MNSGFLIIDTILVHLKTTVFDSNKIGKNNNGKYIIRDGGDYVFVRKILKLTDTELVLINLTPGFTTTGKITTYLKTDMDF